MHPLRRPRRRVRPAARPSVPGPPGRPGGSIRALAAARHPSCRHSWVERVWDPAAVAAAVGPAAPAGAPPGNPPDPGDPAVLSQAALVPLDEEWDVADVLAFHGEAGLG